MNHFLHSTKQRIFKSFLKSFVMHVIFESPFPSSLNENLASSVLFTSFILKKTLIENWTQLFTSFRNHDKTYKLEMILKEIPLNFEASLQFQDFRQFFSQFAVINQNKIFDIKTQLKFSGGKFRVLWNF